MFEKAYPCGRHIPRYLYYGRTPPPPRAWYPWLKMTTPLENWFNWFSKKGGGNVHSSQPRGAAPGTLQPLQANTNNKISRWRTDVSFPETSKRAIVSVLYGEVQPAWKSIWMKHWRWNWSCVFQIVGSYFHDVHLDSLHTSCNFLSFSVLVSSWSDLEA